MTKKAFNIILSLILFIPVLIYFTVWDHYAINIPKWDDHAFKTFIVEYSHATDWNAKWAAFVKQHNEHRLLLTRIFVWLDYTLFDSLNYRHLMTAGNLLLIAVIPLFYILLKNNKKPLFALIPVPFLWLSLAFWENMYWGMSAIQNFGVVTLTLWTIYLCVQPKAIPFAASLFLAALTVLTSGNGLLVLPLGAFLLFLSRDRKRFALWVIVSLGVGIGYFYKYVKPDYNPESKASILKLVKGYMAFLGSFAESIPVLDNFKVCVFLGAILFLVAISIGSTTLFRIIRNKYPVKYERITDLFCLGTILFILATALIVVYSRAGFGIEGLVTSRYKIYSVLLLLVAYLYVVIPIRGSFLSPYITAIIFLAVTFNIFSYHYHFVDADKTRKMLTTAQFNSVYTDKSLTAPVDTSFAANIVAKTPVFYEKWLPLIKIADRQRYAGTSRGLTDLSQQTTFKSTPNSLEVSNTSFRSQRSQDNGIYILLRSKSRYYVFPTYRNRNKSRKELFLKQYYFERGFYASIPFADPLVPDHYDIGLIRQEGGRIGIFFTGQELTIKNIQSNQIKVNW